MFGIIGKGKALESCLKYSLKCQISPCCSKFNSVALFINRKIIV